VEAFEPRTNTMHVAEGGTAYAQTSWCASSPQRYRADCKAKVGPMTYDGMHVVLGSTSPMRNTSVRVDAERRALYNFSLPCASTARR